MTALFVVTRFLHFAALALVVGLPTFLLVIARPSYRGPETVDDLGLADLDRLLLPVVRWSVAVTLVSAMLWLGLHTWQLTGGVTIDALARVLGRTQFGRVWQVRFGGVALIGAMLLLADRRQEGHDWVALRLETALIGAGLGGSLAWAGHAAATELAWRPAHLAADALHLVATGVWLGGLPALALLAARAPRFPSGGAWVAEATRRFSTLALVSVAVLALTGLVNSIFLVGDVPSLVGTPYGRLLLLKLALFAGLLAVAAMNLFRLKRSLAAAPTHEMVLRLRRNVLVEIVLGAVIVLVVGALGITVPGRHAQPVWPFGIRLSWEATKDVPGARPAALGMAMLALAGVAMLGYALVGRRARRLLAGTGAVLIASGAAMAIPLLGVDAYPTTYVRSPVAYTAASIAHGAQLYAQHCAVCHGRTGEGDGPGATGLARRPADLTAPHTAAHTAGDMFWWLTHGIAGTPMPAFGDRLGPKDRWDLINFLRALSVAEQARGLGSGIDPAPWLAAPDFTFGIGVGPMETLKQHRGWAMVHLVLFTLPASLPRLEALDRAWSSIGFAGARIIAVPMTGAEHVYRRLGPRAANFTIAIDGAESIVEAYRLFRFTQAPKLTVPSPTHMEFLVDRRGYVRARWLPGHDPGWAEIDRLLDEIRQLDREPRGASAPDEHVH